MYDKHSYNVKVYVQIVTIAQLTRDISNDFFVHRQGHVYMVKTNEMITSN